MLSINISVLANEFSPPHLWVIFRPTVYGHTIGRAQTKYVLFCYQSVEKSQRSGVQCPM